MWPLTLVSRQARSPGRLTIIPGSALKRRNRFARRSWNSATSQTSARDPWPRAGQTTSCFSSSTKRPFFRPPGATSFRSFKGPWTTSKTRECICRFSCIPWRRREPPAFSRSSFQTGQSTRSWFSPPGAWRSIRYQSSEGSTCPTSLSVMDPIRPHTRAEPVRGA